MGFFVLSLSAVIFLLTVQRSQCAHIVGGKESIPHSRPFMAALGNATVFDCGGSLIKENWVLSAAHCFPYEEINVTLGAHVRRNTEEKGRQYIPVTNVFVYPGYNIQTLEHDIMLLKLQKKAQINQYVRLVQLPTTSDDVQPGTNCLVAGWGDTYYGKKKSSDTLREVNLTIFDREICNNEEHYSHPIVKENMLCAGDKRGGKGSCQGDSGGPLICGVEQRGIVSFGEDCSLEKYPDIYTRLTKDYISWIDNTIRENP